MGNVDTWRGLSSPGAAAWQAMSTSLMALVDALGSLHLYLACET
jgi:hypothetical protein